MENVNILSLTGEGMEASSNHIIVSFLVSVLLDKLSSEALRDFGSVWCVESELRALSDVLQYIQELLEFAEQAQAKNILVKRCLRNLRDVCYRAQDILDEFIYEALEEKDERYGGKKLPFFSFNLYTEGILRKHEILPFINNELIKKLVEIEKELKDHYLRDSGIQKSHGVNDEIDTRPKSGSLFDESITLGRKKEQDEIKKRLLSNPDDEKQKQVSVVAIVGLGGVGKTTLAQLVYNDPDVEKHFERRAWICESTDFNVVRLTYAILESLIGTSPKLSNLEPLQRKLREELRGKRFLIVLDDVWSEKENDWKALRIAFMAAGEGSRIIVTTRSRRVSSIMHPMYTHDLQILSDEECWSIMERRISMDYGSIAPNLEELGRKIAKKCKGLPLAASTLAGLLCSSSDLNHWLTVLNTSMWDLKESNFPAALSLSYYFLPRYLKQFFAYCSVFPKGYIFDKQWLIQLWIAEGFIRTNTKKMEGIGSQYFDDLLHRSFFQHSNEEKENVRFVMHDLVHDLAEAVSGEVHGRFEYGESCHSSSKETRYVSICCVKHMFDQDKYYGDKRLSTLIILNQGYFCGTIESFGGLRYLRVLDLCGSHISMLPSDIGNLKYLHYINLSNAEYIKQLPESLCNLHNLQSLILCDSGIHKLPRGMKYLRNLQHLDLNRCHYLCSMPQGIGRLTGLKTLPYFLVSKDDDGCGLKELKELSQLEGALSIHFPESAIDPLDALEAHLVNKPKVDELELTWPWNWLLHNSSYTDVEILEGLRPHTLLKSLHINYYGGLTFPSWLMKDLPSYNKLLSLTLNCCTCRVLPPIGELPLLESLRIYGMMELEEWSSISRGEENKFPCLLRLTIERCYALRILPKHLLSSPRLYDLSIDDCPELRMLPHQGLSKLTSLKNLHLGKMMEGLVLSLDDIETLPPNLNRLYIHNCKTLPKGLRNLSSLQHLKFGQSSEVHYGPEELPAHVNITRD
ncbi:putative disease resistance protein RGA1 [Macadamia integrifolia]|uniref:putative disease resistance protein RGA1 n=1 Tax=Macadamia integrifolia TaxID=60698 RepID=UPI001C4F2506|nr:putative disease resistance protein RGA1 [Macadamia integrifolia]